MDEVKKTPKKAFPGGPGPGRPKGMPNRATMEFRDTVRRVLEDNSENVGKWLSQVAEGANGKEPAPEKALDLLAKLAEYAAPKLARTELTGENGGAVKFEVVAPWLTDNIAKRN